MNYGGGGGGGGGGNSSGNGGGDDNDNDSQNGTFKARFESKWIYDHSFCSNFAYFIRMHIYMEFTSSNLKSSSSQIHTHTHRHNAIDNQLEFHIQTHFSTVICLCVVFCILCMCNANNDRSANRRQKVWARGREKEKKVIHGQCVELFAHLVMSNANVWRIDHRNNIHWNSLTIFFSLYFNDFYRSFFFGNYTIIHNDIPIH